MMFILAIVLSMILFMVSTKPVHAIIVIVPTVLIPIVHVVVWILGALATPVVSLTALYFKMRKKSLSNGIFFGVLLLILIGLLVLITLKLVNPERPIY